MTQGVAQHNVFCQNELITFSLKNVAQMFVMLKLFLKNAQSKQSPKCRKFGQSGPPVVV
jgi:hypothetical protein